MSGIAKAKRQSVIGLGLTAAVIAAWFTIHIVTMFVIDWARYWPAAPLAIALQCWLYVGMFIIAHDCMHGSLVPLYPRVNRWIGTAVLFLYAGFPFKTLNTKHHDHHRHAGTEGDPDFDDRHPQGYLRWYWKFFSEYLTWRQPVVIGGAITFYYLVLDVPAGVLGAFWAVPALLSSLQLFTFGTYLPHRAEGEAFADAHNARSNDYAPWLSLLTCFHFGYHHEHHLKPGLPWWRLPSARSRGVQSQR